MKSRLYLYQSIESKKRTVVITHNHNIQFFIVQSTTTVVVIAHNALDDRGRASYTETLLLLAGRVQNNRHARARTRRYVVPAFKFIISKKYQECRS